MKWIFFLLLFVEYSWAQVHGHLSVTISGKMHFIVTDSAGRRQGVAALSGTIYDEIPNTGYGTIC